MSGFKLRISGVRSERSTNCVTTTAAQSMLIFQIVYGNNQFRWFNPQGQKYYSSNCATNGNSIFIFVLSWNYPKIVKKYDLEHLYSNLFKKIIHRGDSNCGTARPKWSLIPLCYILCHITKSYSNIFLNIFLPILLKFVRK